MEVFGIVIGLCIVLLVIFLLVKLMIGGEEELKKQPKETSGIYTDKDGNKFVDGMPLDDYLDWVCN